MKRKKKSVAFTHSKKARLYAHPLLEDLPNECLSCIVQNMSAASVLQWSRVNSRFLEIAMHFWRKCKRIIFDVKAGDRDSCEWELYFFAFQGWWDFESVWEHGDVGDRFTELHERPFRKCPSDGTFTGLMELEKEYRTIMGEIEKVEKELLTDPRNMPWPSDFSEYDLMQMGCSERTCKFIIAGDCEKGPAGDNGYDIGLEQELLHQWLCFHLDRCEKVLQRKRSDQ